MRKYSDEYAALLADGDAFERNRRDSACISEKINLFRDRVGLAASYSPCERT